MTEPGPIQSYDNATLYFYSGSYLADGSFFQAGYTRRYPNCSVNGYFAQGFTPVGDRTLIQFGACGLTGTQTFSVGYRSTNPDGSSEWLGYQNGSPMPGARFFANARNIGSNRPYASTELSRSDGQLADLRDTMPGVRYYPALQVRFSSTWYNSLSAVAFRDNSPCPPQNVFADGTNNVRIGTGYQTACQAAGTRLWG